MINSIFKKNQSGKTHFTETLKISIPLCFTQLLCFLYEIVDTMMISNYDTLHLSAIGIGWLLLLILLFFVEPIHSGMQAILTRILGKELAEPELQVLNIRNVFLNALILAALNSLFFFFITLFIEPFLIVTNVQANLIPLIKSYFSVIRYTIIINALSVILLGFIVSFKKTRLVFGIGFFSNVLNVILNYILIYGKYDFPELGIKGAALGTTIAKLVTLLVYIGIFFKYGWIRKYKLFSRLKIGFTYLKDILKVYLPITFQLVGAFISFYILEVIIGNINVIYISVFHIVIISIRKIFQAISIAMGTGSSVLVGNSLGTGDNDNANRLIISSQILVLLINLTIGIFFYIFSFRISALFTSDISLIPELDKTIKLFIFFIVIDTLGVNFETILSKIGWSFYIFLCEIITNIVFILGLTAILVYVFKIGITGAWIGFISYQVIRYILFLLGFVSRKWEKTKIIAKEEPEWQSA